MPNDELGNSSPHKVPSRLTLRLAAVLLSHGGEMTLQTAMDVANDCSTGYRKPSRRVSEALRPLRNDDVIVRIGDVFYAPNLADLAAWTADGFAYREDAGHAVTPRIPELARAA